MSGIWGASSGRTTRGRTPDHYWEAELNRGATRSSLSPIKSDSSGDHSLRLDVSTHLSYLFDFNMIIIFRLINDGGKQIKVISALKWRIIVSVNKLIYCRCTRLPRHSCHPLSVSNKKKVGFLIKRIEK